MYRLLYIIIPLILAVIPPLLLGTRGKRFLLWYFYALILFPFAMIHAIIRREKQSADIFELREIIDSVIQSPAKLEEINSFYIDDHIRYFDPLCPVEVEQVRIKVNIARNEVKARLSFRNIGDKEVWAIKLDLFCYNAFGEETGPPMEVLVQDCLGLPGMIFGPSNYIDLSERQHTRRINAVVKRIVYSDGLLWEAKEGNLRSNQVEALKNPDELAMLQNIAGPDAICYSKKNIDGWICVCGRINMGGNKVCMRCKRSRDTVLERFDRPQKIRNPIMGVIGNERESEDAMLNEFEIRKTFSDAATFSTRRAQRRRFVLIGLPSLLLVAALIISGIFSDFTYSYAYYKAKQANTLLNNGQTPLTSAVAAGDVEQINYLLTEGADINLADASGTTPINTAFKTENTRIVAYLLGHGAAASPEQKVALIQFAAKNGDTQSLASYLTNEKLPAFAVDSSDALLIAARYGQDEVISLFLQYGANIENEDNTGKTALALAVAGGYTKSVEVLIKAGAEINKPDISGETPLFIAARDGHLSLVKLLVENGAEIGKENRYGKDAINAAEASDRADIVKYLESKKKR